MRNAQWKDEAVAPDDRPPRILLCDDNDFDRAAVSRALRECGAPVILIESSSASEAVEHIRCADSDCVFIGDSVARTELFLLLLHIHEAGLNVPVVLVTYSATSALPATRGAIQFVSTAALTPGRLASIVHDAAKGRSIHRHADAKTASQRRVPT